VSHSLDAGTPHAAPASLLDAILALDVALERRLLYPDAHPMVGASREAYARAWAAALAEAGAVRVRIGPGRMGQGEGDGNELPGPRVEAMARMLHALHVTAITVQADATHDDVLALLDLVHTLRSAPRPFEAIRQWTAESGVTAVQVTALDMDHLRYTDRREDAPAESTWKGLQQYLAAPDHDPARAAQELMDSWKGREAMGLAAARAELMQRLENAPPGEEGALSERILKLLAAFPEAVRADLLRIRTPEGSSMLARLVRPLPPRDALTTLLEVGQVQGALPRGTTAILTQILHCLPDGDAMAGELEASASDADAAEVAAALQSMFAKRADAEFNPEDYQRRLDELARQENLPGAGSPERMQALEDAAGLAAAVGGIAALTLDGADAEEVPHVLERIERALPGMLERRRTDLVAVAARAVKANDLAASAHGAAFVQRIAAQLEPLLACGAESAREREDMRAILALLPADTVSREALRLLLAGAPDKDADFLRALLLDADGKPLAALLADTVEKSPERIARVRTLLRDGRSAEVRGLVERLQHHADRRLRTTALAVLVERDGAAEHLDALTEAVTGTDPEQARWALQTLASSSDDADDVTGFLGWLLEKRKNLSPDITARIAALLLQRGEAGVRRAAAALSVVCGSPAPPRARLARRLAASLAKHADDAEVRRALGRWRRSPARLLGWIGELAGGSR